MHFGRLPLLLVLGAVFGAATVASAQRATAAPARSIVLKPARIFDGVGPQLREGEVVLIRGDRIERLPAPRIAGGGSSRKPTRSTV